MNHLREMLEAKNSGDLAVGCDKFQQNPLHGGIGLMFDRAEDALCFDLGDVSEYLGIKPVLGACANLPFKTVWFEMAQSRDSQIFGCLVSDKPETSEWEILFFWRHKNKKWCLAGVGAANIRGGPVEVGFVADDRDVGAVGDIFNLAMAGLSAINCCNVQRTENHPSSQLQKARVKRGKKPLFSYWTLHLSGDRSAGDQLGGTHASPRLHLRRGHPRQFAPGRWTWVQPCVVGNKANGMVHKDYRIGRRQPPATPPA